MGLRPLKEVEDSLTKRISGLSLPFLSGISDVDGKEHPRYHPEKASEVLICSGMGWKGFMKLRKQTTSASGAERASRDRVEDDGNRRILEACAEDIMRLWTEEEVHNVLEEKGIRLRHQPGL